MASPLAVSWGCANSGLHDAAMYLCSPLASYPVAVVLCLSPVLEDQDSEFNLRDEVGDVAVFLAI